MITWQQVCCFNTNSIKISPIYTLYFRWRILLQFRSKAVYKKPVRSYSEAATVSTTYGAEAGAASDMRTYLDKCWISHDPVNFLFWLSVSCYLIKYTRFSLNIQPFNVQFCSMEYCVPTLNMVSFVTLPWSSRDVESSYPIVSSRAWFTYSVKLKSYLLQRLRNSMSNIT